MINPNGNLVMLTDVVTSTSGFNPDMSMALIDKRYAKDLNNFTRELPYYKNEHRSLAKQLVDKSATSADTTLHTIVSMLPIITKQKYSGKYDVNTVYYTQTKGKVPSSRKYSSFYTQSHSVAASTGSWYHDILVNTPVYDPSRMQVGYPMKSEYWNDFCTTTTDGRKTPDEYSGFAIGVNTDIVAGSWPCLAAKYKVLDRYTAYQSMVIFPINSSLVHQVSEISNGAKPVFADFYQDNSGNLAAIKYAMGM